MHIVCEYICLKTRYIFVLYIFFIFVTFLSDEIKSILFGEGGMENIVNIQIVIETITPVIRIQKFTM